MGFWEIEKENISFINCLLELEIQSGLGIFSGCCKIVGSISRYSTIKFDFESICTKDYTIAEKPMDFTPEVEDEVIWDAVSHKLYRRVVNPSNKVWIESTQTKFSTSPFQIGDSIIYSNEEHN